MITCQKCGTQLADNTRFCSSCGAQVPIPAKVKKTKRKWLFPVVSIIVVIALVIGIWRSGLISFGEKTLQVAIDNEAFSHETINGVTISGDDDLVDDTKEIDSYILSDDELNELVEDYQSTDEVILDAFELSAGLLPEERFNGELEIEVDLEIFGISEELAPILKMARLGEDGSFEYLKSEVEDGKLIGYTSKNSIIILLGAIIIPTGLGVLHLKDYKDYYLLGSLNDYKDVTFYKTSVVEGYTIYFPDTMPFEESEEAKKYNEELTGILESHGIDNGEGIASGLMNRVNDEKADYRSSMKQLLGELFEDQAFKKIFKEITNEQWQMENIWPIQVQLTVEKLKIADDYLYNERGFKKPANTDITLLDKWSTDFGEGTYGFSYNPQTGAPFVHLNFEIGDHPSSINDYKNNKDLYSATYDELLASLTHELFHCSQVLYVGYDKGRYIWLWEASAVTIQNEAARYYVDNSHAEKLCIFTDSKKFSITSAKEFLDPDGSGDDWKHQGYYYGQFLEYLRDQYFTDKDAFVDELMNKFGSQDDIVKLLLDVTSNDLSMLEEDYVEFSKNIDNYLLEGDDSAVIGELATGKTEINITKDNPLGETTFVPQSMSSVFKKILMKIESKNKMDLKIILKTPVSYLGDSGRSAFLVWKNKSEEPILISSDDAHGEHIYTEVSNDYKHSESDDTMAFILYLQGIFYDSDTYDDSRTIECIAMYKPEGFHVEKEEIFEDNYAMNVTMPNKSGLFNEGLTEHYKLYLWSPSGELFTFETSESDFNIPMTLDQTSIELTKIDNDGVKLVDRQEGIELSSSDTSHYYVFCHEILTENDEIVGPRSETFKIVSDAQVMLTADAVELYPEEEVTYSVNINNDSYDYWWSVHDKAEVQGSSTLSTSYDDIGTKVVSVRVVDNNGNLVGTDEWILEVVERPEEEKEEEAVTEEEETDEHKQGENDVTYWIEFDRETYGPGDYIEMTPRSSDDIGSYNDARYYTWSVYPVGTGVGTPIVHDGYSAPFTDVNITLQYAPDYSGVYEVVAVHELDDSVVIYGTFIVE